MTEYRRRNTLRYVGYDYTNAGAYFVTIRAHRGLAVFGEVVDGATVLSPLGRIADRCWVEFAERHTDAEVDTHVIMPNHAHVLLWITGGPVSCRLGRGQQAPQIRRRHCRIAIEPDGRI